MIINGIDFPNEILRAIHENSLVIFAGAGVSMDKPTTLPSFKGLAKEVGKRNNMNYDSAESEIDEFLGDIVRKNKGADIKRYIAERLGDETKKPNPSHFALIDLFREKHDIRIITTNQDLMFEKALKKRGISLPVYNAPALPFGDDFSGIIHLHGSVKEPKHMVFTDEDFGNAYMLRGYASRFLVDLFSKYTVLFWGYSYNDRIVRYLTTAITAKNITNAFILSDTEENESKVLGRTSINVIHYPKEKHEVAREALQTLGEYAKRGILDWKQRIKTLNDDVPPIDVETQDEILEGVKDITIQKLFCKDLRGEKWAIWLDEKGVFSELFDEKATLTEVAKNWGNWLAENYYSDILPVLIEKHGNHLNEEFCYMIIHQFSKIDESHSNELFAAYASMARKRITQPIYRSHLVRMAEKRGMYSLMWVFFEDCCEYSIVFIPDFFMLDYKKSVVAKYMWHLDYYVFNELWENYVSKHITDPIKVLYMCTNILESLYTELTKSKGNTFLFDCLDIEHNNQQLGGDDCALVLCRAMQKSFSLLSETDVETASCWIKNALCSSTVLVKRIGLMLLRDYNALSDVEKAGLVMSHFDLHSVVEKEQLFIIVATIFDGIDEKTQSLILNAIWEVDTSGWVGVNEDERRRSEYYRRYNWLHWLKIKCRPNDEIEEKLNEIKKEYPEFQPRKHPELSIETSEGKWGHESPISSQSLNRMSAEDAYQYVISFKEDKNSFGPDRAGLLQTLSEVCSADYSRGLEFLSVLRTKENWKTDLWGVVLNGLEESTKTKNQLIKVIDTMKDNPCRYHPDVIARYFFRVLQKEKIQNNLSKNTRSKLQSVLKVIWSSREDQFLEGSDWPTSSLNNPGGLVAHIMFLLMCTEDAKKGIPSWIKTFISKHVEKNQQVEMFISVMCGYSAQLYYGDPEWTKQHVFCYLSDESASVKQAAWEGFLMMVHNFSTQFGTEILPIFKKEKSIISQLKPEFRSAFIHDYTLLITYLVKNPITDYVMELIGSGSPPDWGRFARTIRKILTRMDSQARNELWNSWLQEYWENRNIGMPKEIDQIEYSEMLGWLLYIDDFETGVKLAMASKVKSPNHIDFFDDLKTNDRLDRFPQKCAELVLHLAHMEDEGRRKVSFQEIITELQKREVDMGTKEELSLLVS